MRQYAYKDIWKMKRSSLSYYRWNIKRSLFHQWSVQLKFMIQCDSIYEHADTNNKHLVLSPQMPSNKFDGKYPVSSYKCFLTHFISHIKKKPRQICHARPNTRKIFNWKTTLRIQFSAFSQECPKPTSCFSLSFSNKHTKIVLFFILFRLQMLVYCLRFLSSLGKNKKSTFSITIQYSNNYY